MKSAQHAVLPDNTISLSRRRRSVTMIYPQIVVSRLRGAIIVGVPLRVPLAAGMAAARR
jgi:hypothetical protein